MKLWPFKCQHKLADLCVEKNETVRAVEGSRYQVVTYHLFCRNCRQPVNLDYSRLVGGEYLFWGAQKQPAGGSGA